MKRALLVVVLLVVGYLGVSALSDVTQSRPDRADASAVTELIMEVREDRFGGGVDGAAMALWGVCSAQTSSRVVDGAGLEALGQGRYRAVLNPAVGHHEEKKLVGCLEDLTVDRVVGDVEIFRARPALD